MVVYLDASCWLMGSRMILQLSRYQLIVVQWHEMVTQIWVNIGSGNCLLPDDTKPLPEPILTYEHSAESSFVASAQLQFIKWVWWHLKIICLSPRDQWVYSSFVKPDNSRRTRSIPWMPMPWILMLPVHLQAFGWLWYKTNQFNWENNLHGPSLNNMIDTFGLIRPDNLHHNPDDIDSPVDFANCSRKLMQYTLRYQ